MAPFSGWGSTASRLEPPRGGSLLFAIKFSEIPGTHFIDLGKMESTLEPPIEKFISVQFEIDIVQENVTYTKSYSIVICCWLKCLFSSSGSLGFCFWKRYVKELS